MRPIIKFDISFFSSIMLAVLSGNLNVYLVYFLSILIHECGHLFVASILGWELDELKFTGLGGVLKFKNDLTKPPIQNFFVAIAGIFFNFLFYLFLIITNAPESLINTQITIIFFNLLPIVPLDGSKILKSFLCTIFPYKKSLRILTYTNIAFLVILIMGTFVFRFEQYLIVLFILSLSVKKYNEQIEYLNERFLLQTRINERKS